MKGVVRKYREQLYANKLDNLDETEKFLQRHKVSVMNRMCPPKRHTEVLAPDRCECGFIWKQGLCRRNQGY